MKRVCFFALSIVVFRVVGAFLRVVGAFLRVVGAGFEGMLGIKYSGGRVLASLPDG